MNIETMIIGTLSIAFLALTMKALYHRNRALKMLAALDADMLTLRAKAGLTSRYQQAQERQRFNSN